MIQQKLCYNDMHLILNMYYGNNGFSLLGIPLEINNHRKEDTMYNVYFIGLGCRLIKKAVKFVCPVTDEDLVCVTFSSNKTNDMSYADFLSGVEQTESYLSNRKDGEEIDLTELGLTKG